MDEDYYQDYFNQLNDKKTLEYIKKVLTFFEITHYASIAILNLENKDAMLIDYPDLLDFFL